MFLEFSDLAGNNDNSIPNYPTNWLMQRLQNLRGNKNKNKNPLNKLAARNSRSHRGAYTSFAPHKAEKMCGIDGEQGLFRQFHITMLVKYYRLGGTKRLRESFPDNSLNQASVEDVR